MYTYQPWKLDRYLAFNKVADWAQLTNGNTPNFYAYDTRAFEVP